MTAADRRARAQASPRSPLALAAQLRSLSSFLSLPIITTTTAQHSIRIVIVPESSSSLNTTLASRGQPVRSPACPPFALFFVQQLNPPCLPHHHSPIHPPSMPIAVSLQDLPHPSSIPGRTSPLYIIFHSSPWDPVSQSWCPDCRNARSALLDVFQSQDGPEAWVLLTDREQWKRKADGEKQHPWRDQAGWGVKCLPTLLRVEGVSVCA